MTGRKHKRGSHGANQIAPILPDSSSLLTSSPTAINLPPELKALPREEIIKHLSSFTTHDSFSSLSSLRRLSTTPDSWREGFRRVGVSKRAFWAMLVMVRNAYISIGCALLTNYLCSIGTLSTKPPKEQPYTRFLAATMFWAHFFFCWVVFLIQARFLMPHRFVANLDQPTTFLFCLRRLYGKTYISYYVSLVLLMATTYGVDKLLPTELRKYKLEFYLGCLSGHVYTTSAIISVRRIFQEQTAEGLVHANPEASDVQSSLLKRLAYFAKVYVNFGALVLSVVFCGGFVHMTHNYHITSYVELAVFVGGCNTFKLFIQEVVKMYAFNKKEKDIRTMWIAIGVPTVLIDTQVRMALQRCDTLEITLTGFASMAGVEIIMRAVKVVLIKLEIRRYQQQTFPTTVSAAIRQFRQEQSHASGCSRRGSSSSIATIRLERWKERALSFRTAEIYAGMAAQYIAIDCATSLLFFYWSHAKYELRLVKHDGGKPSAGHELTLEWSLFVLLNVQLLVEVVVDYLSSLLEIGVGIDFDELRRYGPFVACMFVCMATVNAQISAIIYLRVD